MPDISEKFMTKLRASIDESKRQMKTYNQHRFSALKAFVGRWYADGGREAEQTPFPTIYQGALAYMAHLVGGAPKSMVTTDTQQLRQMALIYELAGNRLMDEIDLEGTIARGVLAAMFGLGIFKVGQAAAEQQVEINGYLHDVGQPFCDLVSQENWGIDPMARHKEEAQWMGDRYRQRFDYAREVYDNPDDLKAWRGGDGEESNEVEELAGKKRDKGGELWEMTELWDIWVPSEHIILTIGAEGGLKPQRVVEWEGPENGPYVLLGYMDVPENILPLPPVAIWRDLDRAINTVGRKIVEQAKNEKEIVAVAPANEDDGRNIIKTADGEVVVVRDVRSVQPLRFGGVNSASMASLIYLQNNQGKNVGNLDIMAGTGGQAETLGQSEMMMGNVSKRIQMMTRRTDKAVEQIAEGLFWYLVYDPLIEMGLTKRAAGQEFAVQFNPDTREGDWLDFNFKIQPYSMQRSSPQEKAQRLQTWWNTFFMPGAELAMQQGLYPNMESLIRLSGRLMDIPEADELVFSQGAMPTSYTPRGPIGKPPAKHESLNVHTRAGSPQQSTDAALVSSLQAQGPGRPPGQQGAGLQTAAGTP